MVLAVDVPDSPRSSTMEMPVSSPRSEASSVSRSEVSSYSDAYGMADGTPTGEKKMDMFESKRDLEGNKAMHGLETILKHQFGDVREGLKEGADERKEREEIENEEEASPTRTSDSFAEDFAASAQRIRTTQKLVSSGPFMGFFLLLTLYSFYAPDLDVMFGSKESEVVISITMTLTLALFLVELVLNSMAKPAYICRFSFWLDLAASLSLLPETIMWKQLLSSNFIASSDESLTRFLMLAARSSRASRLQRLTRLMRIAALLPRITGLLQRGNRQLEEDTQRLLNKKLHRIFAFLDTDYDGKISDRNMNAVLDRLDNATAARKSSMVSARGSVFQSISFFSSGKISFRSSTVLARPDSDSEEERDKPHLKSLKAEVSDGMPMQSKQLRFSEELQEQLSGDFSPGVMVPMPPEAFSTPQPPPPQPPLPQPQNDFRVEAAHSDQGEMGEDLRRTESEVSVARESTMGREDSLPFHDRDNSHKSTKTSVFSCLSEVDQVTFEDFKEQILAEEPVGKELLGICRNQLLKSSYMHSERIKQMEDIGVKVALGVLGNILIVSIFSWSIENQNARQTLEMLDVMGSRYDVPGQSDLPDHMQESVLLWSTSLDVQSIRGSLIFLDIAQRTVCNELSEEKFGCAEPHTPWPWPSRGSLTAVEEAFQQSQHRQSDVVLLRVPDDSQREASSSLEDLNRSVTSLALLNMRYLQEQNALFSVIVTTTAIILILVGIYVFTRQVSTLSSGLLRPIRLLADDMQSVTQMQLAGLQSTKTEIMFDRNVAEIRLIESIFEKTKTAIRSWGKYVPWPVVQILLAAGVDSALKIGTVEVTMFFSDIASFTTIVEKLPPERSLVLLSRYFNDMSQVIDSQGGIVIEFIGDAILSVFGAPLRNPLHAEACVKATMKMLKSLDRINAWSKHRDLPQVNIRCGVHTGEVLVGNMGFHSRIKYGTTGENANIPSKLEELNKTYSTNNLISQDTFSSLVENTFVTRPIDLIYLRSYDMEPTVVYNILCPAESTKAERSEKMAKVYREAFLCYRSQGFKKAAELFQKYAKLSKTKASVQDAAALLMQKRCKFYQEHPPPRDWDGVWDQASEP
ncbi:unnamed protein product [Effrenium voratum]|nr:unnamed protein product [Effrenium voratum]